MSTSDRAERLDKRAVEAAVDGAPGLMVDSWIDAERSGDQVRPNLAELQAEMFVEGRTPDHRRSGRPAFAQTA